MSTEEIPRPQRRLGPERINIPLERVQAVPRAKLIQRLFGVSGLRTTPQAPQGRN